MSQRRSQPGTFGGLVFDGKRWQENADPWYFAIWGFKVNGGTPKNGWFIIRENPMKILMMTRGAPMTLETSTWTTACTKASGPRITGVSDDGESEHDPSPSQKCTAFGYMACHWLCNYAVHPWIPTVLWSWSVSWGLCRMQHDASLFMKCPPGNDGSELDRFMNWLPHGKYVVIVWATDPSFQDGSTLLNLHVWWLNPW